LIRLKCVRIWCADPKPHRVAMRSRERLDREHARHAASMRTRLARLAADVAALRAADDRTPEEIIGYDDAGLPR
jgi:hypothetical protein